MSRSHLSIAIFALSCAAIIGCHSSPANPLPAAGEINSMRARLETEYLETEFDVPSDHYENILSALLPCKHDPNPSKWIVIGELDIIHTDGATQVFLYTTSSGPPGAFSAGPSHATRKYYRGGDSDKLLQAMKDAYEA